MKNDTNKLITYQNTFFSHPTSQQKVYSISIHTTSYFSYFTLAPFSILPPLNITTQNSIGPHWRVLMSFDVGWLSKELASQQIHFCNMALPVLFSLKYERRFAVETNWIITIFKRKIDNRVRRYSYLDRCSIKWGGLSYFRPIDEKKGYHMFVFSMSGLYL